MKRFQIQDIAEEKLLQPWLKATATDMLDSDSPYAIVTAAGLIARLWSPPKPTEQFNRAVELIMQKDSPTDRATRWFLGVPVEEQLPIARAAVMDAVQLADEFSTLEQAVAEDWPTAQDELRATLHQRDDLQCLQFMLDSVGRGQELHNALEFLDKKVGGYGSVLACAKVKDDQRLLNVAWQEVDAWWGQLTRR